jgi:hypothetical protein
LLKFHGDVEYVYVEDRHPWRRKAPHMEKKTKPQREREQKPNPEDDKMKQKDAEKWAFSPGLQPPS